MVFPGHFEDHIIPDKIHVLNVSFLVDSLDRLRGGVAGNIAYSLALLGTRCRVVATAGIDFDEYRSALERVGVDTSGIHIIEHERTASAFITTDRADNQITGFYPGAMSKARDVSVDDHREDVRLGVISPTDPEAMIRHVREFAAAGVPYVFDPGQQIIALSGTALSEGVKSARLLIGNDYEFAMICDKTGTSRDELIRACETVVITYGDLGSTIYDGHGKSEHRIPAARASSVVDPTGAGDGYRAGLIHGMLAGLSWEEAGRIGSQAATFVVEVKGTQSHEYTAAAFAERFSESFPEYADAVRTLHEDPAVAGRNREE
ncbi:MAG: carbohydrate kinase family protein [Thermomicrobiales bacterium]|nr:carbohydrate kinase family protein [Thermomicrobiales bacterium]